MSIVLCIMLYLLSIYNERLFVLTHMSPTCTKKLSCPLQNALASDQLLAVSSIQ